MLRYSKDFTCADKECELSDEEFHALVNRRAGQFGYDADGNENQGNEDSHE